MNKTIKDLEMRKAEIVCEMVAQHCKDNTLPSEFLKAEFKRLHRLGYIQYDDKMFWVNNNKGGADDDKR